MPVSTPVLTTDLAGLTLHRRGKVRDVYEVGPYLLIVATDRISAFDYVLGSGVPDKGKILTQISAFWFAFLADVIPHHLVSTDVEAYPGAARAHREFLAGRSMLVRRTTPLPVECVARGYLSGSGWKDYQRDGGICGVPLPPGLAESSPLPAPIFTPATKAESGHDENITEPEAAGRVGAARIGRLRDVTLELYRRGAEHAARQGIIVADTKFEFGLTEAGDLILIDEVLTPDSSRFWPRAAYAPGGPQPSFDKQFVRDYLEQIRWNKQPPVPTLPDEVVERTRAKYLEAFVRLTGRTLAWPADCRGALVHSFKTLVAEMFDKGIRLEDALRELEGVYIDRALAASEGSLMRAAEALGLHRNTLTRKLAERRRADRRRTAS